MKKTAIILIIALALALATFALSLTGCDDKGDDEQEQPIEDRSAPITGLLDNRYSITVTVKGFTTQAEWNDIAGKIKTRLKAFFDNEVAEYGEDAIVYYGDILDRGVTYIVEPNPEGYSNLKTIGDGKTVYIPLDKIDTNYVESGIYSIQDNGSVISKATPTANKGATT